MRETDQEVVDRMVADKSALPAPVVGFLTEEQAQDEMVVRAGREIWSMHSRKCRRNLEFRLKVQPSDLWGQIGACTCGWPEQKLREQVATQA